MAKLAVVVTEQPHFIGHRERLRERLLRSPQGSLPDYEILELLLCLAKPRGDVKPLAKKLIAEYGSLAKLLSADPGVLIHSKDVGTAIIASFRLVQEVAARLIKEELHHKPIFETWKALLDYVRATQGTMSTETLRILYLNKSHMLIADELQTVGSVDLIPIIPREIAKRAICLDASAIIMVHNHPSGITKPSRADLEVTQQMVHSLGVLGIDLHDHVIISQQSHYSFKANGLI
jgi:DNA repair protein RadC